MRRPFTTCVPMMMMMMLALATAARAQTPPPTQTPPTQAPAAAQPPAAQPPAALKLPFTTDSGLLMIQIKPDQTAAFEELMTKLKAGVAKTTDEGIKKQMAGFKVYKSSEGIQGNALYVAVIDPTVKDTEYELFALLQKVLTPEELRDPAVIEMSKKAAAAFAVGYNKLNLTPLGGGM
jgi:hypothetical protein